MEETKALRSGGIDSERDAPDVDTDARMIERVYVDRNVICRTCQ